MLASELYFATEVSLVFRMFSSCFSSAVFRIRKKVLLFMVSCDLRRKFGRVKTTDKQQHYEEQDWFSRDPFDGNLAE